ncbi:MAG: alpha/beta hydrolase [Oleiphilaceae bacterium]|nr:alpha/beta hydrolase [Oleiphilaceae bacterium]
MEGRLAPWSYETGAGFTVRGLKSQPRGRPLLHFIHGNGYSGLIYERLLSPLLDHVDLIISDIQGHGDSDYGGKFLGWNATAVICEEALRNLQPDYVTADGDPVPIFGMGHSFGGVMTALIMARSPDLFRQAVLLDPVLFTPAMAKVMALSDVLGLWQKNQMANRARKRRFHWPDADQAFQSFHQRGIFKGWEEDCLQSYVRHGLLPAENGGVILRCLPEREAELFASYPKKLWPALRAVRTPTHVIHGEGTFAFVARSVARWQATNPAITSEQSPGGHCFMMQYPEATVARILASLPLQNQGASP